MARVANASGDAVLPGCVQIRTTHGWEPLTGQVSQLTTSVVPCTETTLSLFDRLRAAKEPIIRHGTWTIMKCFDDEVDGFPIQDMLREFVLRGHSSINAGLLKDDEEHEFLWQLFCHLSLGGAMNQFEDDMVAYRDATKVLYKDLVSYDLLSVFEHCACHAWAVQCLACTVSCC
jgi:hypothetical protein